MDGEANTVTEAQLLLEIHLTELGIACQREFRFCANRKFRFDLYVEKYRIGIEVNGSFKGKHGTGWDGGHDNEKIRLAQILGYKILPFTNREVMSGKAKEFLAEWLSPIRKG